ncbi:MAG: branched chain amino acid aminotransferase [Armatimonadetes bacterium RBG_19FT_COMBO_69_19]|nr:MAG: branched chain amino acid aminotransferase [Armatimonadetes bacterium RBG_19FT_COMBO_69_19]
MAMAAFMFSSAICSFINDGGMEMAGAASIWFNGALVSAEEARVPVTAHALHYGSSVFEGIRAYATPRGPAVFCLPQHVRRLMDSCRIFRMTLPYTASEVTEAIVATVRANNHESCYIRPLVFRGPGTFSLDPRKASVEVAIITFEWGRYLGQEAVEQGVDVMVSSWRRAAPDTAVPMAKIGGQYVTSQFIAMEAADHGFTEGIALDAQGFISEGSGENVFVVRDGVVFTPPLSASVLPGVTRAAVLTLLRDLGLAVREEPLLRETLYMADEVFFTGTAAEITPVRSVDRIAVGEGRRGPVTARVAEQFFGITGGHLPDRHGWLTDVNADRPGSATRSGSGHDSGDGHRVGDGPAPVRRGSGERA